MCRRSSNVIVIMQENHSFDNYFGALAYAPNSPYRHDLNGCRKEDHDCVDGLTCKTDASGNITCFNSNVDDNGSTVFSFHDSRRCAGPDLDHSWFQTHQEVNFLQPMTTLANPLSDGFVRVNDITEQHDNGVESPTDDQTMGFYTQDDIPFYYDLAQKFAVGDRYFAAVLGPTFPNRSYLLAATSFGHDHVASPSPAQGHQRTPDGISPGQCADLSNVPASLQPGAGAECAQNLLSKTDTTVKDAEELCPELAANPTGPYPDGCPSFDQLGLRVPFLAISAFSKPHYVSHTIGSHTSLLAFIENRFMSLDNDSTDNSDLASDDPGASRGARKPHQHLTLRDQHANTLEDLFDFDRSPSLNTAIGQALPPAVDCTP